MARLKKSKNGYIRKTFTFEGHRYSVYGKDNNELLQKYADKLKELQEGEKKLQNPTLNGYYETFTDIRRNQIRESTLRGQLYQFKGIAAVVMANNKPFGEMHIKDIKKVHIEEVRQKMLDQGKTPEYLNNCFFHLNHVFAVALDDEVIEKNPCKALKKLKREAKPISETKHRALSEAEAAAFIREAEARNSFYVNVFKIMLFTGMRVGEVGALYVTDIDKEFIHVRRTVTRDEVGNYLVGEDTKTYSGKRGIPITPEIMKVIRDQKELNNMVFGLGWTGNLFQSSEGGILREYTVNREIKRVCKAIDLEYFTCHGFRVTFATRFIEQRPQDFKILSEIMGHKDIKITLNIYTKVMTESKVEAMNNLKIING